jgi:hypothetical protein
MGFFASKTLPSAVELGVFTEIIMHSLQTVFVTVVVLALVLK